MAFLNSAVAVPRQCHHQRTSKRDRNPYNEGRKSIDQKF